MLQWQEGISSTILAQSYQVHIFYIRLTSIQAILLLTVSIEAPEMSIIYYLVNLHSD